jgi:DNA-binding SARP family transcriptional activator
MEAMRIQLCGRIVIEIAGRRLEGKLPGRQGTLLFAYLAANRFRPVARGELVAVLWPEEPPPRTAETTLAGVLSRLRQALGASVVEAGSQPRLVLPPDAWIDLEVATVSVHVAQSAVATGAWPQAWISGRVALHIARREFLAGYDASWIDERRRGLQTVQANALECIGEAGLGLGGSEIAAAERSGRALIAIEPYRESGYRLLMRAFEAHGNVAAALVVYDELRCLLRDELGIAPSSETQALHRELLSARPRGAAARGGARRSGSR